MANKETTYEKLNKFERAEFRANLLSIAYNAIENRIDWYKTYDEDTKTYNIESSDPSDRDRVKIIKEVLVEFENML